MHRREVGRHRRGAVERLAGSGRVARREPRAPDHDERVGVPLALDEEPPGLGLGLPVEARLEVELRQRALQPQAVGVVAQRAGEGEDDAASRVGVEARIAEVGIVARGRGERGGGLGAAAEGLEGHGARHQVRGPVPAERRRALEVAERRGGAAPVEVEHRRPVVEVGVVAAAGQRARVRRGGRRRVAAGERHQQARGLGGDAAAPRGGAGEGLVGAREVARDEARRPLEHGGVGARRLAGSARRRERERERPAERQHAEGATRAHGHRDPHGYSGMPTVR